MNEQTAEETPKSFWGIGIGAVYISFMAFMLTLVFFSSNQKFELVSDNYYEEGTNYQIVIDSYSRAAALEEKPLLIDTETKAIQIPLSQLDNFRQIEAKLYRPDNSSLDQTLKANPDQKGIIQLPELKQGNWKLFLKWQDNDNKEYRMHWSFFR